MNKNAPVVIVWWPNTHEQRQAQDQGQTILFRFEVHSLAGQRLHRGLEALHKLPKNMPCMVLVDPTEVSLFPITPPKVSGNKLKEALPFIVEPFLLNEPEENHVMLWPLLPNNQQAQQLTSVVSKRCIREIIATCKQTGLKLTTISTESLRAIIHPKQSSVAWFSGDYFYCADGSAPPLVADTHQAAVLNALLGRKLTTITAATIAITASDLERLNTICQPLHEQIAHYMQAATALPLSSLFDLRQRGLISPDDFRQQGIRTNDTHRGNTLRKLVLPCVVLIMVCVLGLNLLAFKTKRNLEKIDNVITSTYVRVMPNTPMVADPLLLIEREKRNLNSSTQTGNNEGLTFLLHEVGQALDDAPFNSLSKLSWNKNELQLEFNASVSQKTQEAAIAKLKSKKLDAKWLATNIHKLPTLQVRAKAYP